MAQLLKASISHLCKRVQSTELWSLPKVKTDRCKGNAEDSKLQILDEVLLGRLEAAEVQWFFAGYAPVVCFLTDFVVFQSGFVVDG